MIAVDAMGGDHAPSATVEGALEAFRALGKPLLLVGREADLEAELSRLRATPAQRAQLEIVPASEVVGMDESALAVRKKRDASVRVAARLVKEGRAEAFVSAGNTGAAMVAAKMVVGVASGVSRPALATVLPNQHGRTILIDVGANIDSKPHQLQQFAVMGHFYAQEIFGVGAPRIGLLSIGEEEGKGNDVTREVFRELEATGLNFLGNVEGGDIFNGTADVVVCDGFVGNAILKSAEGLAEMVSGFLREELESSFVSKLGALFSYKAYVRLKRRTDYSEYGGAPLLGLKGGCFIAHGRSSPNAIRSAIFRAQEFVDAGIHRQVSAKLSELSEASAAGAPESDRDSQRLSGATEGAVSG